MIKQCEQCLHYLNCDKQDEFERLTKEASKVDYSDEFDIIVICKNHKHDNEIMTVVRK